VREGLRRMIQEDSEYFNAEVWIWSVEFDHMMSVYYICIYKLGCLSWFSVEIFLCNGIVMKYQRGREAGNLPWPLSG
jgi:hypothetical protein